MNTKMGPRGFEPVGLRDSQTFLRLNILYEFVIIVQNHLAIGIFVGSKLWRVFRK